MSSRSNYALRSLAEMATHAEQDWITAEAIGRRQHIPHSYLQTILADLRRAGLVSSHRGNAGGWRLAKKASQISIADVILAIDGPSWEPWSPPPDRYDTTLIGQNLTTLWNTAGTHMRSILEHTTLDHLTTGTIVDGVNIRG